MALNKSAGRQSSWLTIVNKLDNVPHTNREGPETFAVFFDHYWTFMIQEGTQNSPTPVGYIADWLVDMVHWDRHPRFTIHRGSKLIFLDAKHDTTQLQGADSGGSKSLRALIMELLEDGGVPGFRQLHHKGDCCQIPRTNIGIDRNAAQLFGLLTMGAHMTCYTLEPSEEGCQMKLWVPRRAFHKKNDAGKLDNTVAGGISNGDTPLQTILAEAEEEAALNRDFVTENVRMTGTLSFFNQCPATEGRHMRPRVLYTFELELPQDMVPTPHDGEVCEFLRIGVQEMKEAIMAGEMTDDAAIVWLGFLVRHGIVDEQNEPDLQQITDRMHRHLPFPIGSA
ncbi:putative thiamin pyrophosphokinase-related protein [Diaporthe ampelina]|uniref:Putative thiamin pyrophosphokinase-related protein n=1 Tax=Diaporthe ampelina TaxID=1214573 RepID=A0A0G2HLI2_9PEZI|nr:putative thiamin pyrophosphokinase-related protein [Diaporthe ampelina]